MNSRLTKLLSIFVIAAFTVAIGCSDDDDGGMSNNQPVGEDTGADAADMAMGDAGDSGTMDTSMDAADTMNTMDAADGSGGINQATSAAADTRAKLTNLLQEHVYLAGITLRAAVLAGGDLQDPGVSAAVATLDENTVALADAIGGLYGTDARGKFLKMWRDHIGYFVDYTLGKATDDAAKVDGALADLKSYREDFSSFISTATEGGLPQEAVKSNLVTHVDTVTAAIDGLVAGEAGAFDQLRVAAQHMPTVAAALSGAFDDQFDLEGESDSPGADLRASLTSLLQEHVYLAGITVVVAVKAGGDLSDPMVKAAQATLDENTVALADAIGGLYGTDARGKFLKMWRDHIGYFVDYTLGKATDDAAKVDGALADLKGYREDFSSFVVGANQGEVTQDAIKSNLVTHVDTLTAAIDAVVAGDTNQYTQLRVAAQHMPTVAAALSGIFYNDL